MKNAEQTEFDKNICVELLRTQRIGRLVYDDGGPQLRPVNYIVIGDQILLRMDRSFDDATRVVFEIDSVDTVADEGWSVIVEGRAYSVPLESVDRFELAQPWAPGEKSWSTTIVIDSISGRYVKAQRENPSRSEHGYL
jgi:nitroimidazol reductase NimA-like FMN-containing flavoprotein (pyridoxamine 5'-phosphate oxidase superfamily)